jgi:hypothetical protein
VRLSKRHTPALVVALIAVGLGVYVSTRERGVAPESGTLVDIQKSDLSRIAVDWYPDRDKRYDKDLEKRKKEAAKTESGSESGESSTASESASAESSASGKGDAKAKRIVMHKVVEGEDEYWMLDEPVSCRIDPTTASALTGRLGMLKAERTVEKEKGEQIDAALYGLDEPVARVTLEGRKGETTTLLFGRKHPTATSERFARVEGRDQVAVVTDSLLTDLTREAKDIRDKRLFTLKSDEVKVVQVGRAHTPASASGESGESSPESTPPWQSPDTKKDPASDSYTLTKGETDKGDSKWSLSGPMDAEADSGECSTLLSGLTSKKVEEFVVEAPTDADLARYGLADPAHNYTLTGRKKHTDTKKEWKSDTTETLSVGNKAPGGKSYYARVSWRPEIVTIAAEGFDIISKSASDLRKKALHDIAQTDLTGIETVKGGFVAKLTYDRKEKKWNLADGQKTKEFAVTGLVSGLANLSVSKFVTDEPGDLATYGLDQPSATVVLTPKKGEPVTITFGKPVPDEPSLVYAKRADRNQIVALESYRLMSIPEKLSDIADVPAPPVTPESSESGESAPAIVR